MWQGTLRSPLSGNVKPTDHKSKRSLSFITPFKEWENRGLFTGIFANLKFMLILLHIIIIILSTHIIQHIF